MKVDHRSAAGSRVSPRKYRMQKTSSRTAQHDPAKAQRVTTVLQVGLAYRSGVIREQPAYGSNYHGYISQERAAGRTFARRSGRDKLYPSDALMAG